MSFFGFSQPFVCRIRNEALGGEEEDVQRQNLLNVGAEPDQFHYYCEIGHWPWQRNCSLSPVLIFIVTIDFPPHGSNRQSVSALV